MSQGWESRQQRTRAEILHAVGEIIAADGLDGSTMRKLADRAGVAVATLYNQFTDRDGVLVAFVSSGLDQLEFELDEQPAADPIDAHSCVVRRARRNHRCPKARVAAGPGHVALRAELAADGKRR